VYRPVDVLDPVTDPDVPQGWLDQAPLGRDCQPGCSPVTPGPVA
jgi:hypothetical protein